MEELKEAYNRSVRIRTLSQAVAPTDVDAVLYLSSFFKALLAELYIDPLFHEQISDILKVRSALSIQRSLADILSTLHQLGEVLASGYTPEQFEEDVVMYTAHVERTHRYLKLVGVVPKDQGDEDADPELYAIFVPLHITLLNQRASKEQAPDTIADLFKASSCSVLLGGPGSGKSTTTHYLAWSHANANLLTASTPLPSGSTPLLPGKPLPLRIELRRLTEDRRHHPHYNFLSYTTEVLLGRAGLHINQLMFEGLLERRAMLVLFDGLDEVATLDERRRLIEEIEEFTFRYPGNRILVTSRPVGYEAARFSNRFFAHFQVQFLNDQQIRTFLEHWYIYVRRLSPLSLEDQQELEVLYTTLTKNPRLHALATNPLLLTVIAALHRYERLPDRRVQVYDRCADLLLNIWARLRGTVANWKEMKMSKEIQYVCVAHLGFVLHERSQGKQEKKTETDSMRTGAPVEDAANDVPTRFMLREIKQFLESRDLFSAAERHVEAERFLELIQTEAGLIVEQGTDENGEPLYGFIHRTFQEYFAAVHIYEYYQEEENAAIISDFLAKHLYDPHWNEVILLLFGKLKVKPATAQLRHLLDDNRPMDNTSDILQQNLFFACTCLCEEVVVEHGLAGSIVSRLSDLAKTSPFPSQRTQALETLTTLAGTRHYGSLARKELIPMVTQRLIPDLQTRIQTAQALHKVSPHKSEEWQQIIQTLLHLAQQPDLTIEQVVHIAQALYKKDTDKLEERQHAIQIFLNLSQRPNLSFEQAMLIAQTLYQISPDKSKGQQQAIQMFVNLVQQSSLSFKEIRSIAQIINEISPDKLKKRSLIVQALLNQLQQPAPYFNQVLRIALICKKDWLTSDEHTQMLQMLMDLTRSPDLSSEQALHEVSALYGWWIDSPGLGSAENKIIYPLLLTLVQRPDLPFQQALNAGNSFYYDPMDDYHNYYNDEEFANQIFLSLAQRPQISFEQAMQIAQTFSKLGIPMLLNYVEQPDLSIEQRALCAMALYIHSDLRSPIEQQAAQLLWQLIQEPDFTIEQKLLLVAVPLRKEIESTQRAPNAELVIYQWVNYQDRARAVQIVLNLLQKEDVKQFLEKNWRPVNVRRYQNVTKFKIVDSDIPPLLELISLDVLPIQERDKMYKMLQDISPQFRCEDIADS